METAEAAYQAYLAEPTEDGHKMAREDYLLSIDVLTVDQVRLLKLQRKSFLEKPKS